MWSIKFLGLLNELWIIWHAGLPIYHQSVSSQLDQNLFGGFISAINTFVKEFGEDQIKKMEMGGSKIIILSSEDKEWFFIGRSDIKENEKKLLKYLDDISKIFFNHFGSFLNKWDGNIDIFQELDNLIDINNPETPEKQSQIKGQKSRGAFL